MSFHHYLEVLKSGEAGNGTKVRPYMKSKI